MDLDPIFKRAFGDDEPERLGSGWWSGVIAVFFGMLGLFGRYASGFPNG